MQELYTIDVVGAWLGIFLTFAILSFLYKDNPFYKLAEHLFVGVSLGYVVTQQYYNTLRPKLVLPTDYAPIKGWKIAYSPDLCCFEVDPEVRRNTEAALDVFRGLGATVEEVDLGWPPNVLSAAMDYLNHLFGGALSTLLTEHGDDMTTYCRAFAELGQGSSSQTFVASLEVAGQMYQTLGPLLEE